MTEQSNEFNWVKARNECSLGSVFESLKLFIQNDVETRNSLRQTMVPGVPDVFAYKFSVNESDKRFSVLLRGQDAHKSVTFHLKDRFIEISTEGRVMFTATVGLNENGKCSFFVDGQEKNSWQVRKKALDGLFFDIE